MLPDLTNDSRWRKASASGGEGGQCIQVHPTGALRDSKNPFGPVLVVDADRLVAAVKGGRFER